MVSFFDEIAKNRLKSIILMSIFSAIFFLFIYFVVLILGGGPFAYIIGGGFVLLYAAFTYFAGGAVVLKVSGAQKADRSQYPVLFSAVEGLASASQIPVPEVYTINDPNPNAFATGRNKNHASVAVTTGLLSMMNKDELQGVIAHEISHVSDNDIQFMMLAIVFAGVIGLVSAFIRNSIFYGMFSGNNNRNGGPIILIALVLSIIAPLVALMIRLAISRKREYMADANGGRLTRDPRSLASALKKIQGYASGPNVAPVRHANDVTASLYFSNPLSANSIVNLFSTHPPIADRIKRLEQMY